MKTEINIPVKSKINWTGVCIQLATILFLSGVIPHKWEAVTVGLIGLLGPAVIQYFRTYRTKP